MTQDIFDDLAALQINPDLAAKVQAKAKGAPRKAPKWKKHFIRVPWSWVERLRDAHHVCTWKLAMYLLYEDWRNGGQAIVLSNSAVEGVKRQRKWDGLCELEQLRLIRIERRPRKSPLVTVLTDQEIMTAK